ncbi:MAG: hypothetical protein HQL16_06980 [Candidatus Omnitrophica bacterium]|nr:hypothetical protein [Candidatus Omnitrophota bacterium]
MAKNPKKKEKLTIEEYTKKRDALKKKRFHFTLYPWPIMLALTIPLVIFVILLLEYILYIRTLGN